MAQGRGWEGAVLKLMRARDFTLTVTANEQVSAEYRRIRVTDGGLLDANPVHPTMWVRLWFQNAGRPHQRAYTLVDPDPESGTFALEFALHEGAASDWARGVEVGGTIEATVQGTGFESPVPSPTHVLAIGDPASLPAINSLLDSMSSVPATVWFEGGEGELPFRHGVRRVPRGELVERVRLELPEVLDGAEAPYVWIACDTRTTRVLSAYVRKELGVPKERVHALGYWRAG
ncbi:siderophore-interacting protein [Streptomyces acidiscabies]|uniref:Siderophore-interacting protein n=1 Tax=Streptomyces acidiscabies TaxID=42234 RepID=A0AAP6EGP9_9ACTN|nr:siderophore-interacting protein [Streptomyces acidiscabies]MBP5938526.1 siderophore-interacting protein [Streptomyces sp. LBUM 1476]MBZ3909637.1 siderophore-interacting protein [Streptomyces acidiscabies]MDX2962193.1 siderophore-interacting protein [Streptomyces acidiscabies]MDX3019645.1 siderophore-interacting protein [Streptomyces acidiscabies]MDX3792213.1 siderophore-interacting protein [Streptomyces acidiscabies]